MGRHIWQSHGSCLGYNKRTLSLSLSSLLQYLFFPVGLRTLSESGAEVGARKVQIPSEKILRALRL